ncbi:hypothetical protein D9757_014158 [Collybiopsis confluens]|uniref:Uncharacterized protein n=1 Tax=Collybiopsis confluens TaxID=2823264 RepID=A0A8H5FNT4_9AGAR|nr:hypothetical protein D9757_014158 [Collybiopsis confluens]
MNLRNHFTNVEETASRHTSRVAFKIPQVNKETNEIDSCHDITCSQYLLDIERFAAYWYHVLSDVAGIPQRSVIALCFEGEKYVDFYTCMAFSGQDISLKSSLYFRMHPTI